MTQVEDGQTPTVRDRGLNPLADMHDVQHILEFHDGDENTEARVLRISSELSTLGYDTNPAEVSATLKQSDKKWGFEKSSLFLTVLQVRKAQ